MISPKEQMRLRVQERLDRVGPKEHEAASQIVRDKVKTLLLRLQKESRLKRVLLYRANAEWREVDLSGLESVFAKLQFDYAPMSLGAPPPVGLYDIVLVPLYGFNNERYRLGHGKGWYDKFLVGQPQSYKIGVGLEVGRLDFPTEPHDIPLDVIVTERGPETPQRKMNQW